jgi:hypothetical protein
MLVWICRTDHMQSGFGTRCNALALGGGLCGGARWSRESRLSSEIAGVPNLTRSAKTQLAARRPTDLRRFSYAGKSDACASLEPGYMIVQFKQEVVPMKTLASVIGILTLMLFMAACSSQSRIDQATQQAESSAQSAATAATKAQKLANQAAQSAKRAQEASMGAQDSVHRATDAVARLEAAFASTVTK